MNRDPILFRVDGTAQSGWERLTRCLTYAGALQRRRRPAYFLSQLEPASLGLNLKRAGNDWLEADGPAGSPEDLAKHAQQHGADKELVETLRGLKKDSFDGPSAVMHELGNENALGGSGS